MENPEKRLRKQIPTDLAWRSAEVAFKMRLVIDTRYAFITYAIDNTRLVMRIYNKGVALRLNKLRLAMRTGTRCRMQCGVIGREWLTRRLLLVIHSLQSLVKGGHHAAVRQGALFVIALPTGSIGSTVNAIYVATRKIVKAITFER